VAAKYSEWNAGVATVKRKEQAAAEYLHEASKPLARYADDADLEAELRERERADDPMLEYVRKKKAEKFKEANPGYVGTFFFFFLSFFFLVFIKCKPSDDSFIT
jgi:pre-mRNA-splicing factor CWC26